MIIGKVFIWSELKFSKASQLSVVCCQTVSVPCLVWVFSTTSTASLRCDMILRIQTTCDSCSWLLRMWSTKCWYAVIEVVTFVVCIQGRGVCCVCVTSHRWVTSSLLESTVPEAFSFSGDQINHRSNHPNPLETNLNLVVSVVEWLDSLCNVNVFFPWSVSVLDRPIKDFRRQCCHSSKVFGSVWTCF